MFLIDGRISGQTVEKQLRNDTKRKAFIQKQPTVQWYDLVKIVARINITTSNEYGATLGPIESDDYLELLLRSTSLFSE